MVPTIARSRLRAGGYPSTWANRPFMFPTASNARTTRLRYRPGSPRNARSSRAMDERALYPELVHIPAPDISVISLRNDHASHDLHVGYPQHRRALRTPARLTTQVGSPLQVPTGVRNKPLNLGLNRGKTA